MWKKGMLLHCWWECKLVQPLWRTIWRFLKKLKIELPYYLEIPLLGMYLEKMWFEKIHVSSVQSLSHVRLFETPDTCTPMLIAALFTAAKTWKQPKCPLSEEWIKMWYMYTMKYYSAIKELNNAICSNMDGSRYFHTK